ncbi:hypothetical protein FB451DRAFT_1561172 [Mycena latifolia]|nr:hypothetical protein FB451DRAFT_1561172 [Mycena latifolia]
MSTGEFLCFCSKPAANRCSACKTVSYCSQECQRRDWKEHKIVCKSLTAQNRANVARPPQVATPGQMDELFRIAAKHTILPESMAQGLDPSLIHGATGFDLYGAAGLFWRLHPPVREELESKAHEHNQRSKPFWKTYFAPITHDIEWIDVVLDIVLNARLPNGNPLSRAHAYAGFLAGLFPHLSSFTPAQNSTLLDIFGKPVSEAECRAGIENEVLFAHGEPSADLIAQLVGRCLSTTRPVSELAALLTNVALPIQTYWPNITGTRILDLALVMASPWRPGPMDPEGRRIPGDKLLEIAETCPAAAKHLLHAVVRLCRERFVSFPAHRLLRFFEAFGVEISDPDTDALAWLFVELPEQDRESSARLQQLLKDADDGALTRFGLVAKDDYVEELRRPTREALRRLGEL